jgi:tetratricopeptide (TPR) repeat protein
MAAQPTEVNGATAATHALPPSLPDPAGSRPLAPALTLPRPGADGLIAGGVAIGLLLLALVAKGGIELRATTTVEIATTLIGAAIVILAVLNAPTPARSWGVPALALLGAFAGLTALSVTWSVAPTESWTDANRMIASVAVFATGLALARLAPERPGPILVGLLIGSLAVCLVALLIKSFPVAFDSREELARLRRPLDYWNALGLIAALGIPAGVWAGARREVSPRVRALAAAALSPVLIVLVLSFSRGAIVAGALGLGLWLLVTPRRLRGLVTFLAALVPSAATLAWALSEDALTKDKYLLSERLAAGHRLAVAVLLAAGAAFAIALVAHKRLDADPPSPRIRGRAGLAAVAVVLVFALGGIGALAASHRGLTGSITHVKDEFLSSGKQTSPGYGPSRLTSASSLRGAYYHEANKIWQDHTWLGVGGGGYATARLRYRENTASVRHAHGFVHQTLADLGLVGIALAAALLAAFMAAALRATALLPSRASWARGRAVLKPAALKERALADAPRTAESPLDRERIALRTLFAVVVIFGIHSAIDWTWNVPATAFAALLCAGFIAGHGPTGAFGAARAVPAASRLRIAAAIAVIALCSSWAVWQPQRSASAVDAALTSLSEGRTADALVQARAARVRNPVAIEPLTTEAAVQDAMGHKPEAQQLFEQAVRLQPANPLAWQALAEYRLNGMQDATSAFAALRAALYLDPRGTALKSLFLDAYRRLPRGIAQESTTAPAANFADILRRATERATQAAKKPPAKSSKPSKPSKSPATTTPSASGGAAAPTG